MKVLCKLAENGESWKQDAVWAQFRDHTLITVPHTALHNFILTLLMPDYIH